MTESSGSEAADALYFVRMNYCNAKIKLRALFQTKNSTLQIETIAQYNLGMEKQTTTENRRAQHGGARPGQGRKSLKSGGVTAAIVIRVTPEQRDKYDVSGGAKWLRALIDSA